MAARRAFLVAVHGGDACPLLLTDDSLRHAFTPSRTSYHPHSRAAIKALPTPLVLSRPYASPVTWPFSLFASP